MNLFAVSLTIGSLGVAANLFSAEISVPKDFPTLQSAIDSSKPGDTILVSPGTYRERIVLKPGITVRSQGSEDSGTLGLKRAEETIIDGTGGKADQPGVTMAEGAVLDGFTVTAVGAYDDREWQHHWDTKGMEQRHDSIGHFGVPAIASMGVTCSIRNNVVHHNGSTGIALRGEEGKRDFPLVINNICYRNMGGGIGSMQGSTGIIEGNRCFENFHAGIGHDNASPLVTANDCYRNVRAGIGISEGACPIVRNNHCHENRRAGIGIRTGETTRPIVESNECDRNEMAGIGAEEHAAPIIRDNHCHHNRLAGIGCQEGSHPILVGNRCLENGASGIGIDSAAAIVLQNHCEQNKTAGIGVDSSERTLLYENTCSENGTVAVGIPNGGEVVLAHNTLSRSGGMPPMVAVLKGATASLLGNQISGGGVAAVMIDGNALLTGNTLIGSDGGSGIFVRDKGSALLHDNEISGYRNRLSKQGTATVVEP
ncbi:MAG: right-handed parallel beta-helix repeat-containing protein [Verrucomicrobiae bacterium]|nr:right-handed parallel beta-helix repeat-containing protein [Verrucomicrobiae bacterium]